jgi:hypothetical protein
MRLPSIQRLPHPISRSADRTAGKAYSKFLPGKKFPSIKYLIPALMAFAEQAQGKQNPAFVISGAFNS